LGTGLAAAGGLAAETPRHKEDFHIFKLVLEACYEAFLAIRTHYREKWKGSDELKMKIKKCQVFRFQESQIRNGSVPTFEK
jgi:hypothetical protein